ncbi:hypothetical protein INT45_008618 [Circinella minor]|uniref:Uncharacterized protein n=1 Tax=Circinella minor TaxID=1195481 RepID=A0A8H7S3I5_9FUNG|nr:hypothetical protein INT45_008618 [Circinella minor]
MGLTTRHSLDRIYGRPADHGKISTLSTATYYTDSSKITRTRLASEQQEVATNSNSGYQSFGHVHQHQSNDDINSWQKDSNTSAQCLPTTAHEDCIMDETGPIHWLSRCYSTGQPTSQISNRHLLKQLNRTRNHITAPITAPMQQELVWWISQLQTWNDSARTPFSHQLLGTSDRMESITNAIPSQYLAHTTHHLTLTTLYVPSAHNPADSPSRAMTIQNEWKLPPATYQLLDQLWGPHHIYLFASATNHQTKHFQALENGTRSLISSPPLESYSMISTALDSESTTCNTNNTKLAISTLVSTRHSASTTTTNSNQHPSKRERSVEQESNMDLISMEPQRKTMKSESGAAIAITNKTKNINPSTKIRQAVYERWCEFTDLNFMEPNVFHLTSFLASQYETKKWKISTVLAYQSSILALYTTEQSNQICNHQHFQDFHKGLRQGTILPQKFFDYNLQPALSYILSLGDNNKMTVDLLTAKLAWLLAMVGFLRPSDLEHIDLAQCSISQDDILSLVIDLLVCPVNTYKAYCSCVASISVSVPHPVFTKVSLVPLLRYVHHHDQGLSSQRISKYINQVMKFVGRPPGAPIPKARALGAILAAQSGVSVENLVVQRNWSSRKMFEQFYRISVQTQETFTSSTLDSQPRSPTRICDVQ